MSGINAILFLDSKGKTIITRCYRGVVPSDVSETFVHCVIDQEDSLVKPVFARNGFIYCWIKHHDIYVLALTLRNSNTVMISFFLYRLVEVLKSYFKVLQEESLRDNFVVTYELLDEMMDAGHPQVTDGSVIRQYIKNQAHQLIFREKPKKVPACITQNISWRAEGIKHKRNEVYLDVVEKLNMVISSTGTVLKSEVLGVLKMKSRLSGMPELKLGLNDKVLFDVLHKANEGNSSNTIGTLASNQLRAQKCVELEDIQFHQCVRLPQFMNDRSITFIPPDGDFKLMSYRLATSVKPLIAVECNISEVASLGKRLSYSIKAKTNFRIRTVASNVEIHIPVPEDADTPAFEASIGSVKYKPNTNSMVWYIKHFQGQYEHVMSANFGFPSTIQEIPRTMRRPISIVFEIAYFTVSSLTVRYLKIVEKSGYQALPWVRYITKNGDYFIRTS